MEKYLVYMNYDCETGHVRDGGKWEMWSHKPEIGYQPGGRCYSWMDGLGPCQASGSSCYWQVEKVAESPGDMARALVEYNRNKGFVLNIENAEERNAGEFRARFNPDREKRVSRLAGQKPDPEHPDCILCAAKYSNVPEFLERGDYCLFPNPYPIFKDDHFTLVYKQHEEQILTPQRIMHALHFLSEEPSFRMIFNGVHAGASIYHFHFQGFSPRLPVEDFDIKEIASDRTVKIGKPRDYPASAFVAESSDAEQLAARAHEIIRLLSEPRAGLKPTHNVLFSREGKVNRIYIFPRDMDKEKSKFYASKPAAVEMSGMLIMSRDEDRELYENADSRTVRRVLEDVTVPENKLDFIYDRMAQVVHPHFL